MSHKHNWFYVQGDIRVDENMTSEEFAELLDKLGLEFVGGIKRSIFTDEDYE